MTVLRFLDKGMEHREENIKLVSDCDADINCDLEIYVTGGITEDVCIRIGYSHEEIFEHEDNSKHVIVMNLDDILKAAASWEESKFCSDHKYKSLKAIASYLRHKATVFEMYADDKKSAT